MYKTNATDFIFIFKEEVYPDFFGVGGDVILFRAPAVLHSWAIAMFSP